MGALRELVVIAAGGHAAEIYSYLAQLAEPIHLLGLIDEFKAAGPWEESRLLGGFEELARIASRRGSEPMYYLTAVGNNALRRTLVQKTEQAAGSSKLIPWTLIHPAAAVGRGVEIGPGTLLAPGSQVTTRCRIGRHCILNVKATVSHDCEVADFVNLNPGCTVCGNVKIGEGAFIGAGATVINGVSIGADTTIGAGAVVTEDIPERVTAVGVPARIIKRNPSSES